jgi:hypothetical protein
MTQAFDALVYVLRPLQPPIGTGLSLSAFSACGRLKALPTSAGIEMLSNVKVFGRRQYFI